MDGRRTILEIRRSCATLPCGHQSQEVSEGRCWDCHLDELRRIGQGDRADRLVELRRLREEGLLRMDRLADSIAAAYEESCR